MGNHTKDDLKKINTRWIGGDSKIYFPETKDSLDTFYACSTNKEWNAFEMSLFGKHLKNTYPKYCDKHTKPPHHTILIQYVILWGKDMKVIPWDMHNYIMNTCGDDNLQKNN